MHHPMRRKRQLLPDAETVEILRTATSGVLALCGVDGYPYAVPMSFAYEEGKLYFHSATSGAKLDAIAHDDRASFCIIADDEVAPSTLTTHFRSAIVFGRMRVLTEDSEKRHALIALAEKYAPAHRQMADEEIEKSWDRMAVLELSVEEMSGKAAIEVIAAREHAPSAEA